jgi:hypothetical protein
LLVRDHGLDPFDLSALASIHIGAMSVGADCQSWCFFDRLN